MSRSVASLTLMPPARAAALGLALGLAALGAGCGEGDSGAPPPGAGEPPRLTIVEGRPPEPASEPLAEPHKIEGYASAMGSNGAVVVLGASTSAYEVGAAGPTPLAIVGDEPDLPLTTGAVRAIAPYDGGVLVAAESALFFTGGGALQLSAGSAALHPLAIEAMTSRIADDDGDGASETHAAVRSKSGAFDVDPGAMTAWTVDGESGAPTAMYSQKSALFLAFGPRVYEIDKLGGQARPLGLDVGSVSSIACASVACEEGSLLYFASDRGLVERSADGRYALYTLAGAGEPSPGVEGFALDGSKQRLYALAGASLLRLRAGEAPDAVASLGEPSAPRVAAVDKQGDVWLGEGQTVTRLAVGVPLSFAADVRPIMHEYCAGCHAAGQNGAPTIDFESYSVMAAIVDVALMRVINGTMPPATYTKKMPKEKSQILQDWSVTKAM